MNGSTDDEQGEVASAPASEQAAVPKSPPRPGADSWIGEVKGTIAVAAAAIAGLFGLFGGYLARIAPPDDASFNRQFPVQTAEIAALVVLLAVYAAARRSEHHSQASRHQVTGLWTRRAVAAAVMSGTLLGGYLLSKELLCFQWPREDPAPRTLVAGVIRTKQCRTPERRALSNAAMLDEAQGDREYVWSPLSTACSRLLLLALYAGFTMGLTGCLFALAEVIRRAVAQTAAPGAGG